VSLSDFGFYVNSFFTFNFQQSLMGLEFAYKIRIIFGYDSIMIGLKIVNINDFTQNFTSCHLIVFIFCLFFLFYILSLLV